MSSMNVLSNVNPLQPHVVMLSVRCF